MKIRWVLLLILLLHGAGNARTATSGAAGDTIAPSISFALPSRMPVLERLRIDSIRITDATAVRMGGDAGPRVYYKRRRDPNILAVGGAEGWRWASCDGAAPLFRCNVDLTSLPGGVAPGDTLDLFVIAQDWCTPPNVAMSAGRCSAPPAGTALDVSAFPILGEVQHIAVCASISGLHTIGGGVFPTLKSFFDAVNRSVVTGSVTCWIAANTTERDMAVLDRIVTYPPGAKYGFLIAPTGGPRNITGNNDTAVLCLRGASDVEIDGLDTKGGGLVIVNMDTSTSAQLTSVIRLTNDATNTIPVRVTIRRCTLRGGSNTKETGGCLVTLGPTWKAQRSIVPLEFAFTENLVLSVSRGILLDAARAQGFSGVRVTRNRFGSGYPDEDMTESAIWSTGVFDAAIERNTIRAVPAQISEPIRMQRRARNLRIDGNRIAFNAVSIGNVLQEFAGIRIHPYDDSSSNIDIVNNAISLVHSLTDEYAAAGIWITGGNGLRVLHNSVHFTGTPRTCYARCAALAMNSLVAIRDVTVLNNIFANVTALRGGSQEYVVSLRTQGPIALLRMDYNVHALPASGRAIAVMSGISGPNNGRAFLSLEGWRDTTGFDAHAIFADPLFNDTRNLRPLPGSAVLGAGSDIAGVLTDLDGVARSRSAPSIGAFETARDERAPLITLAFPDTVMLAPTLRISAVMTAPGSAVDTRPGFRPRVYYRLRENANAYAGNTKDDNGWKWAEAENDASPFTFLIDHQALYGRAAQGGDTVELFAVAQNTAFPPVPGISSGELQHTPASVQLPPSAFPVWNRVQSYYLVIPLRGTVTVGGDGAMFTRLTELFQLINAYYLTGDLTIEIAGNTVEGTNFADLSLKLEEIREIPSGSGYRLLITPRGGPWTVQGSLSFNGTDNVTIDGKDRLTFEAHGGWPVIKIEGWPWDGSGAVAHDFEIRHCTIDGTKQPRGDFATGIHAANDDFSLPLYSRDDGIHDLSIVGNRILGCARGIFIGGGNYWSVGNVRIDSNRIGSPDPAETTQALGIQVRGAWHTHIGWNEICNIRNMTSELGWMPCGGIVVGPYVDTLVMEGNRIHDVSRAFTGDVAGIHVYDSKLVSNVLIANNEIRRIWRNAHGILLTGGRDIGVYHNSIHLVDTVEPGEIMSAMRISGAETNLDVVNNVFSVRGRPGERASASTLSFPKGISRRPMDYNDFWAEGSGNVLLLNPSFIVSDLDSVRTLTEANAHSISADPRFFSDEVLSPRAGSPLLAAGLPLALVPRDINGELRDPAAPSIGAYEVPSVTSVQSAERDRETFSIETMFPNPYAPDRGPLSIMIRTASHSITELIVTDLLGRMQRKLRTESVHPGITTVQWDGRNETGKRVLPGVYMLRVRSGARMVERNVVIVE